jgi:DNA-binding transcriptional LysR family regulator
MQLDARHPDIDVQLSGTDSNTGALIGRVSLALRRAGVPSAEIGEFWAEVLGSESHDAALQVMMRWVNVS